MTETENRKNHEYSYNKYYTMPSREELHRGYSGWLNDADFIMSRGNNQKQSRIAEKIASASFEFSLAVPISPVSFST